MERPSPGHSPRRGQEPVQPVLLERALPQGQVRERMPLLALVLEQVPELSLIHI